MGESHIKSWQRLLKLDVDGDFGPGTLEASLKVAQKAGIIPAPDPTAKTGRSLLNLAATRIGERYVFGANVNLNDPNWHGPWDCAEFITWDVKQVTGKIYGVANPGEADPDPYTGGWARDADNGRVISISVDKASVTPGAILLRFREGAHHIVFSTGDGGTIEAKGAAYGVCRGTVGHLSSWDYGILIPEISYS
jgi:N-acetylmuramoyl-L-alanine amidase